jgi:predicted metal-dependent peptidase
VATAETQARMQGKFPAHLESVVGEMLQPKLDWKSILRDMITSCAKSDYRLMPPNKKHLWRGIYLPSIAGEEIRIACAIDSSGSISDDEIQDFLSEVKGICESYDDFTLHLLVADAAVHQQVELHPFDPLPTTVHGRGGTSFVPAIQEAEKLEGISSLVYFTDLYGDFPPKEPNVPVIWVCTTDQKPPWGYLIPYPQEERPRRRR